MMKYYLFEIVTKDSEFEGNQVLIKAENLNIAWDIIIDRYTNEDIIYRDVIPEIYYNTIDFCY